jgi:hypothetical protein
MHGRELTSRVYLVTLAVLTIFLTPAGHAIAAAPPAGAMCSDAVFRDAFGRPHPNFQVALLDPSNPDYIVFQDGPQEDRLGLTNLKITLTSTSGFGQGQISVRCRNFQPGPSDLP